MDLLLLDDKRFELLRVAIDTETVRIKENTSLKNLRFKMLIKMKELSATSRDEVQKFIGRIDKHIEDTDEDMASDKGFVANARELIVPVNPEPALIQKIYRLLGEMRVRHSEALRQQAMTDGLISDAEYLLAAAQL